MIEISEDEQTLFAVFLDSLKYHKRDGTVLRVAGGWVRDKLLDHASSDIDIALNDQSGEDFARAVNEYLSSIGKETKTIAVIQVTILPRGNELVQNTQKIDCNACGL